MEGMDAVGNDNNVGAVGGPGPTAEPQEDVAATVADATRDVTPAGVQNQAEQVVAAADDAYDAPVAAAEPPPAAEPAAQPAAPAPEAPSIGTQIGQALRGYATGAINFAASPVNLVNSLTNWAISPITDYRFRTDLHIAPQSPMEATAQRGMENALTLGTLALGVGELALARTAAPALTRGTAAVGTVAAPDLTAAMTSALARGETVLLRGVAPMEANAGVRIADGGFTYASGTAVQPAFALDAATLRTLSADQLANINANLRFYADAGATLERAAIARQAAGLQPAPSALALRDYAAAYGIEAQGYVTAFSVPAGTTLTSLARTANVDGNVARYVVAMPPNATPLGVVPSAQFVLP